MSGVPASEMDSIKQPAVYESPRVPTVVHKWVHSRSHGQINGRFEEELFSHACTHTQRYTDTQRHTKTHIILFIISRSTCVKASLGCTPRKHTETFISALFNIRKQLEMRQIYPGRKVSSQSMAHFTYYVIIQKWKWTTATWNSMNKLRSMLRRKETYWKRLHAMQYRFYKAQK